MKPPSTELFFYLLEIIPLKTNFKGGGRKFTEFACLYSPSVRFYLIVHINTEPVMSVPRINRISLKTKASRLENKCSEFCYICLLLHCISKEFPQKVV